MISEKRKETLCNNNLSVKYNLTELRAKLKKLGVNDLEVFELIDDSRKTLRIMKDQGQHMENRLQKYVDVLSSLGFERVRKNKEN